MARGTFGYHAPDGTTAISAETMGILPDACAVPAPDAPAPPFDTRLATHRERAGEHPARRNPTPCRSPEPPPGPHSEGASAKAMSPLRQSSADMLRSIMRSAASARPASMWATASRATTTSRCRM